MMPMKRARAAFFFPPTGLAKTIALALILLLMAGCHAVKKTAPAPSAGTATTTGIPACDSYLAHYEACHGAAGIYPAATLQAHYQAMRDTLLQEAGDPHVRPYLAARCQGLAQQMRDTLQGRSCTPPTAALSSAH
jgi:hypothetical protein